MDPCKVFLSSATAFGHPASRWLGLPLSFIVLGDLAESLLEAAPHTHGRCQGRPSLFKSIPPPCHPVFTPRIHDNRGTPRSIPSDGGVSSQYATD